MEQFRQIGEVIGSLRALMVFRDEIHVNRRQCCLLVDALNMAFDVVAEEMRQHLKFEEKNSKWNALEGPMRELCGIFKEGEGYIRQFLDAKDLVKAVTLSQSTDCVDFHLCNLFWCITVVTEAIENVAKISGSDREVVKKKREIFAKKYEREWMDPKLFQIKFGKQYLLSQDLINRMACAWKEDQWILNDMISENRVLGLRSLSKQEERLKELFLAPRGKLFPGSLLVGSREYQLKRRLGSGSHCKEIQWMGHNFAIRQFFTETEPPINEVSLVLSVKHPNVMCVMYAFYDEERKECLLTMELMSKSLSTYIKETCSSKRRLPFPLLVAVDIMLQVAQGMEYLHSQQIYHGNLTPSHILVRSRNNPEGYFQAKITGFGLLGVKQIKTSGNQLPTDTSVWHAPEVLPEHYSGELNALKFTEKADIYSFAMICFQLLTGKVPFEDDHIQSDKVNRNVKAGMRPLFPFQSPKYLTNFIKICWHADPSYRPCFSSICRVFRKIKQILVMNPDHNQSDSPSSSSVDYYEVDQSLIETYKTWFVGQAMKISDIPFQMFAYQVIERERLI